MTDATKVATITKLVQVWDQQQGHSACWYYPEIFEEIANILDIELKNKPTIPLKDFKRG